MRLYTYVVIEDEDLLRNSLIKKIQNFGFPLELRGTADNGLDGLELVSQVYPDLIFLDIMMPVMGGIEMAEKIHASYPEIKMIIVSGYNDFELARQAIRFGVKEYMLKPIDIRELQETLQRVLEEMQKEEEPNEKAGRREFILKQMKAEGTHQNGSKEFVAALVKQYLQDHYREEISLGELAKETGFSPDYLSRMFKKYNQESPIKYLTHLRIEKAKEILRTQIELGIGEVGERVGYSDPYYFSRVFKEQTDLYPKEYRQSKILIAAQPFSDEEEENKRFGTEQN